MLIDNESLTSQLPFLKGGLAARNVAAGSNGFLLEGRGDHIAIVASNQFSETSCKISAADVTDAVVAIPSQFADIVEKCSSSPIDLKLGAKRADLTIGSTKARLQLQPGATFPRLVVGEVQSTVKIASKGLKKALEETIAFAPSGHVKNCLNGILLILQRDRVICVGTNGHVMAVSSAGVDMAIDVPVQRILPVASLRQLLKILDFGSEVTVTDAVNVIGFSCGLAEYKVKPIPERYPDWKRLMSPTPTNTVEVDKSGLVAALQRSSVFADAKAPSSMFVIGNDGLQISSAAKANEIGESADIIPVVVDGDAPNKRFAANLAYMLAATNAISSQSIRLSYSTEDRSAFWFRKSDADDCVVIVTPMTI